MREILRRLTKMVAGYGAVLWAGPFLSFIFTPIITRILSPSDYGVADVILSIASALGTLALVAQPQTLIVHFNDRPDDTEWQRSIIGSSLTLGLGVAIPLGLAVFLLASPASQITFPGYAHLYQIVGIGVSFGVCNSILTAAAQAGLHVRWGMLFSAINIVTTVGSNVLYIIILRLGATGMILTPLTSAIALSAGALFVMRKQIGRPRFDVMHLLLRSGLVLLPNMIAAWALNVVDRLILVQYVSTESLGYYAIANKIASLLGVLMGPLYSAWTPLALSMQHDPAVKDRYATMSRYIIGAALLAALGLGLFATEILLIFTRVPYLPAAPYVGFVAYVYVFSAFSTVLYTSALAGKRLKSVSLTTIAGAAINILLNFLLIPTYGIWGSTIATVIGYAVPVILLYLALRNHYSVPYPTARLVSALAIQFVLLIGGLFIPDLSFPIRIMLKSLLFLVLPASFLLLGIITPLEIKQLWELIKAQISRRLPTNMG